MISPRVSFDQISTGTSKDAPHSVNCSVWYGNETAEIMFIEADDLAMSLQLAIARDKLRRLGNALLQAADSPDGVSVDNLPSPVSPAK
jgi:hypothetical protein